MLPNYLHHRQLDRRWSRMSAQEMVDEVIDIVDRPRPDPLPTDPIERARLEQVVLPGVAVCSLATLADLPRSAKGGDGNKLPLSADCSYELSLRELEHAINLITLLRPDIQIQRQRDSAAGRITMRPAAAPAAVQPWGFEDEGDFVLNP